MRFTGKAIENIKKGDTVLFNPKTGDVEKKQASVEITKKDFNAYVRVQMSGVCNMLNIKIVREASGLDKTKQMEIIKNYEFYEKEHPDVIAKYN